MAGEVGFGYRDGEVGRRDIAGEVVDRGKPGEIDVEAGADGESSSSRTRRLGDDGRNMFLEASFLVGNDELTSRSAIESS